MSGTFPGGYISYAGSAKNIAKAIFHVLLDEQLISKIGSLVRYTAELLLTPR
ncbi:hypothetical protein ABHI18_004143 [Aspergillus niger]